MEDRGRKKQLKEEFQTLRIRTAYLKIRIREEDRRRKIGKIATGVLINIKSGCKYFIISFYFNCV